MSTDSTLEGLFDPIVTYPDADMQGRFQALVGLDSHKEILLKKITTLVNPRALEEWAQRHHPSSTNILETLRRRPPLIVLSGDVGSGKTELAMTIGDEIARKQKIQITLYPLSLSARGQGRVGEMTQLISSAFDIVVERAKKLKSDSGTHRGAVILLVDEADALAQSREAAQMHHEDKAGVNAFIRGIDRIANNKLSAAVIMCTNRLGALDPAIKRRAAEILEFRRPSEVERRFVLASRLTEFGFSSDDITEFVAITGAVNGRDFGFTFSDLTQRLFPAIVLDAFPDKPISPTQAKKIVARIAPTPPFREN